ncbi:hypothetical protein F4801DRAFT_580733 [Xylaria longipes]|nr:hypothetical protein F4801DRAFT_580733 [Xylaria longipes]
MYDTKVLFTLAALADASLAQTSLDLGCSSLINEFVLAAPAVPANFASAFGPRATGSPDVGFLSLSRPDVYVEQICEAVASMPSSMLPDFASYASLLLHFASVEISSYDSIVTKCVATGTAAASITSFIHSIVSTPGGLCKPTSTSVPSGRNNTASITPYPTATPSGNSTRNSTSLSTGVPTTSVPTAAAARPTGAFIGAAAVGGLLGAVALL